MDEEQPLVNPDSARKRRNNVLLGIFVIVVLAIAMISAANWISKTTGYGVLEEEEYVLAQCLSGKGAVFYGAEFCEDCIRQKDLFDSYFDLINYIDCTKNQEACRGLQSIPAWKIGGQMHYGLKGINELRLLSEC